MLSHVGQWSGFVAVLCGAIAFIGALAGWSARRDSAWTRLGLALVGLGAVLQGSEYAARRSNGGEPTPLVWIGITLVDVGALVWLVELRRRGRGGETGART